MLDATSLDTVNSLNLVLISPEFLELCEQIDKNHTFSHIPKELRVKEFFVERDEKVIEQIQSRVIEARKYLTTL